MKLSLPILKPRNPLVTPSRLRQAGAHRRNAGGQRQQAQRALRREIDHLRMSP